MRRVSCAVRSESPTQALPANRSNQLLRMFSGNPAVNHRPRGHPGRKPRSKSLRAAQYLGWRSAEPRETSSALEYTPHRGRGLNIPRTGVLHRFALSGERGAGAPCSIPSGSIPRHHGPRRRSPSWKPCASLPRAVRSRRPTIGRTTIGKRSKALPSSATERL